MALAPYSLGLVITPELSLTDRLMWACKGSQAINQLFYLSTHFWLRTVPMRRFFCLSSPESLRDRPLAPQLSYLLRNQAFCCLCDVLPISAISHQDL